MSNHSKVWFRLWRSRSDLDPAPDHVAVMGYQAAEHGICGEFDPIAVIGTENRSGPTVRITRRLSVPAVAGQRHTGGRMLAACRRSLPGPMFSSNGTKERSRASSCGAQCVEVGPAIGSFQIIVNTVAGTDGHACTDKKRLGFFTRPIPRKASFRTSWMNSIAILSQNLMSWAVVQANAGLARRPLRSDFDNGGNAALNRRP